MPKVGQKFFCDPEPEEIGFADDSDVKENCKGE